MIGDKIELRERGSGMMCFMKSRALALIAGLILVSSGFAGCGGGGSGSQTFTTSKALGETAIILALAFAPIPIITPTQATQAAKATTSCANGGSMSVNPDGSITFYNCSFAEGLLFNGTIRIVPQSGTQNGRIEFDNFSGTLDDDTGFEMDGYIEETENADGSFDLRIDLNTTTTYQGEPDVFNIDGNLSFDQNGNMGGSMFIDNGDSERQNTLCDFEGKNVYDYITEEGTQGGRLMDDSCRELDTPFS